MRSMLMLVAVLGLAAYPAMAAVTGEKGPLDVATGQQQGYGKTVSADRKSTRLNSSH